MARRDRTDKGAGALGFGAAAMLVCCGAHLLVLGALGGLALGTVVGVGGGVAAFVAVFVVLIVRRRRRVACAAGAGSARSSAAGQPAGSADARREETSGVA